METHEVAVGMAVKSVKHPEDLGKIVKVLFKGRAVKVLWNKTDDDVALSSLLYKA